MDPKELDDAELKREIDEALGDMSIEDLAGMGSGSSGSKPSGERGRIRGRILSIRGNDVFVDIGGKSEGFLPKDEFEPDQPPQEGQELEFIPQGFDRESGLMRLSLREALVEANLEQLTVGDVVKGRVTGTNIGGLELRIHGLRGFMPMSQVDLVRHDDFKGFIGRWLEAEVTEIDRKGKNLVLSRRRVLEREREEEREKLKFQLAEGQIRKGVVRRLADYGAFVDLGGIDGLLHVSDMSYSRVDHPKHMVKEGDEIEVKILKIDLVKDRISLGMKQLNPDPWMSAASNYAVGSTIEGKVVKLMNFGAFVELEPGIEGLIPISEMSWTQRLKHPGDMLKEGDQVRATVLNCDAANRKLSLSLKALSEDPWEGAIERYPAESVVSGAVTRILNYGAFVQLEEGIEGLIHISELSNDRVRSVADVVKEGEVVKVRVLGVDPDQRRISLSMKPQPGEVAVGEAAPEEAPEEPKPEKKRKRPLRGGLAW